MIQTKRILLAIADGLPIAVPVGIAAFGAVAMVLLVAGWFYLWALLVFGVPAAAGAMWAACGLARSAERPTRRQQMLADVLAAIVVMVWAGLNLPLSAQHVFTDRDPATYAVAGAWLATHHDLRIPVPAGLSGLPQLQASSLGFGISVSHSNEVYAQGAHLLPALLGFAGKLFGQAAMLHGNVVIGAAALLAFYGFARLVLRPKWALLAMAALAVSLPFVYFSRDTYTEPLTLLLIFSTLAFLIYAARAGQRRAWLLAGITAGASTLVRVDAYTFLATLLAYVTMYLAVTPQHLRRQHLVRVAMLVVPAVLLSMLGWMDVSQLSSGYYRDLHQEILAQLYLIAALTGATLVMLAVVWQTQLAARVAQWMARQQVRVVIAALLGAFFILLAVRAFWLLGLALTGRADAIPVQAYSSGTTFLWLLWYIGPVLTVAGIAAFVYGWTHVLQGRVMHLLPLLLALSADTALYLLSPNISADQVWASRRFLPVIFPGFIVLGFLALQTLRPWLASRGWTPKRARNTAAALAVLAVLCPALTSLPFWRLRPFAQLAQISTMCDQLPSGALVVWVGQEGGFATQPVQAFCGTEALSTTATGGQLAALLPSLTHAAAVQHRPLYVGVRSTDVRLLPSYSFGSPLTSTLTYSEPEHTYKKFPLHIISHTQTIVLLRVR